MHAQLGSSYQFIPIAVETLGPFGPQDQDFFRNLGQTVKTATGDHRSLDFLMHPKDLYITIQRGIMHALDLSALILCISGRPDRRGSLHL